MMEMYLRVVTLTSLKFGAVRALRPDLLQGILLRLLVSILCIVFNTFFAFAFATPI